MYKNKKRMFTFPRKPTTKFFAIFFVMAVFLFSQNEARAAYTFDTFAQSSLQTTNPATLSYTTGSGTTVLVVMLAHTQASRTGGAPTYNGVTMSQVDGEVLNQQEVGAEMWYLIDPPTGSAYTISVPNTAAGSIRIYGASFKAQSGYTSALDVSSTTNVDAANPSLALTTTVNGAAVIDILADGDASVPTGRSHTLIANADEGQRANEAQYALQSTAGLITLSHTIASDDVAMIAAAFKEVAKTTTLGNGTDPGNTPLAPGGTATMADAFTFQTSSGTDSITAAVVGLASGTSGGLSLVEITNDASTVVYGSAPNPATDTPSISLSDLTATTVSTQYKIRVTPKSHASMPSPPGSTYSVTAKINSWTGTNSQAGSDTAGTTVTIDNASPSATTGASATEGDTQITVSWTNPGGDFSNIVILRDTATIGLGSTPAEGTSPSVGSSCGGIACQVRYISTGTSFIDTGLTNGTTYYYRLFPKDTNGNYTAYAPTQQVSAMPVAAPAATTAISNFVTAEPSNNTIAPGASEFVDFFGLQTSTGSDTVTGATVTLASGTGTRVTTVAITNNGDTTTYCSSAPSGDTATLTGCGILVSTTNTQFKIKITAASHIAMPAPQGASYAVTGRITSFTSTNAQSGSDSGSATITIDNLSPSATTGANANPGDTQVQVSWTNPTDSDFQKVIIYCKTSSITETPTEGTDPSVDGAACNGTARVKYSGSTSPQTFTGLTNGTTYYFRIYARDMNGNFTAYSATQEVSTVPAATTYTITATAGLNGTITPAGITTVAQGGSQMYTITPDTGYNINTLLIDGGPISTSTTYTFTDVQANRTIEATFIAIPTAPGSFSIAATAGVGGTISPSGLITVTEGDSQMFTITPDSGYNIASILIDGSPLVATSTTYTFTNVTVNHTIEATFTTPVAPAVPARRAPRPITVTFSGKAFSFGKISIVDKELASGKMTTRDTTADIIGTFSISFVDIIAGAHTFGILAKDKDGRSSQSKFYTLELSAQQLEERNILLPPTIDLVRGQVSRGKNATVIGFASPNSILRIEINGILTKETPANADGSYRIDIPTGALDFGQHKARVRQYSQALGQTSDYSPLRSLIVSRLIATEADLSGDGKIDIQDWSIFLSRWTSKEAVLKQSLDLNGDGKVNIADFSIFIKTIRRK